MIAILTLPIFAALWRLQGGAWFAPRLPGRPLWYVAPIIGALTALAHGSAAHGLALALALLWYGLVPHGRWFTLGRAPRELAGPPSAFEKIVERFAGANDHLSFLIAKAFASIGSLAAAIALGSTLAAFIAVALPIAIVQAYEFGWRISRTGTHVGEWLTGALIGIFAAAL
jgi:hypothetical protein